MAEVNGKLVTCDRCGAQVFLKTTGEGEADGGYTRWNKFEPFPDGWDQAQIAREKANPRQYARVWARLCPGCMAEWDKTMARYMDNTKEV